MARKLTEEQEIQLADMYASEQFSVAEICKTFNVARVTAHRIAARQGVRRSIGRTPLKFSEDQIQDMINRAINKESHTSIAKSYGTSQCKISRILASRNVPSSRGRTRRGQKHGAWKGGRTYLQGGYVLVWVSPEDRFYQMANKAGYVLEHRFIMAQNLGRPLTKTENVHHINGIRDDNRIENLELWTKPQPHGVRSAQNIHCVTCSCILDN